MTGRILVFFDMVTDAVDPNSGAVWLQITQLKHVADPGRDPQQKIIRLSEEQQRELFSILATKYSNLTLTEHQ